MNANNRMFILFKEMKQAYANNDIKAIEQYAFEWSQLAEENPFKEDSPEYSEFFHMQRCCSLYCSDRVDRKINRRKMIHHAVRICEINPKQPYTYDKKADQEENKPVEIKEEKIEVKKQEEQPKKQVVLGVIPEGKEEKEEKKSWFKFLHPWKKEGE